MAARENTSKETERAEEYAAPSIGERLREEDNKVVSETEDGYHKLIRLEDEEIDLGRRGYQDSELISDIWNSLNASERTPESEAVFEGDLVYVEQEEVPYGFDEAIDEYGVDHVVRETVGVVEEYLENGFMYKDLSWDNIRFTEDGEGVAVDWMDGNGITRPGNGAVNTEIGKAFELLAEKIDREIPETSMIEIEKAISENSEYFEVSPTGNLRWDLFLSKDIEEITEN